MPTITVDEEVFNVLIARRQPECTVNDLMREILGLPKAVPVHTPRKRGRLAPLISAGLLTVGQEVTWYRRHSGTEYTATVTSGGFLSAYGREYVSPDQCATALAGYPAKGWPRLAHRRRLEPRPAARPAQIAPFHVSPGPGGHRAISPYPLQPKGIPPCL